MNDGKELTGQELEEINENNQDEEYRVLREEFDRALRDLISKKAAEKDEIRVELL